MTKLCEHDAVTLRRMIGARSISARELLESCIERVEALDPAVNALPIRCFEDARRDADAADAKAARGEPLGPLHGLPITVKDLNHVRGLRTTFGSPIYKDFVAEKDDQQVTQVREAGAIIFAKSNTTEFGAGSNTTNAVFGPTRNPFDLSRTSGGSSGGAAAALALDMAPLCMGNDTGGSLRVPSTFCGTVAIRPTPGAVPHERRTFSHSTFQVQGPMARNVADLRLLFEVMAQPSAIDPMSLQLSDLAGEVDLSTLRVAVSPDLGLAPTTKMIRATFESRIKQIAHVFKSCDWVQPDITSAVEVNWVLRALQFLQGHERHYREHRELLGPLVIENYEAGQKIDARRVAWAMSEQMRLHQRVAEFFQHYDILICPGATIPPFDVDDLFPRAVDGQEQETYVRWAGLTNALSVTNTPVAAIPCGTDATGMPFGFQVTAPHRGDHRLLKVCQALEGVFSGQPSLSRPRPVLDALTTAAGKR